MSVFLQLIRLMKPHLWWVVLGVLVALLTIAANMGLLALSSWFIASMAIAGITGAFFNYTLPAAAVRAFALGRTAGRYLERLINHNTTFRILAELRVWFYSRLESLTPQELSRFRSGDLLSRIGSDVDSLDEFYVRGFVPVVVAFLACDAAVLFLSRLSINLAVVDLGYLALVGVGVPAAVSRLASRAAENAVVSSAQLRDSIVSYAAGIGELIALGETARTEVRIRGLEDRYVAAQRKLNGLLAVSDSATMLGMLLSVVTGAALAVAFYERGMLKGPAVAMVTVFMLASFESVLPIAEVARKLGGIAAAAGRLFALSGSSERDTPRMSASDPGPVRTKARGRVAACEGDEGRADAAQSDRPPCEEHALEVEIDHVRFGYPGSGRRLYDDLTMHLPAGSRTAVVGPSGSGKSTIAYLLLRLFEVEAGSIRFDGESISTMEPSNVAELVSFAEQRPYLFHDTVSENLRVARRDPTDDELQNVLRAVGLEQFIAERSSGPESLVGESGMSISGGEARRVAVARALLKPAPFVILDEPTEGLDAKGAATLIDGVFAFAGNRTLLIITHRPYGLDMVDRVIRIGS